MSKQPNSPQAWFLAARPKTLTGAIAPVLVGAAFAYAQLLANDACPTSPSAWADQLLTVNCQFLLCLLFAIFMQIDANFINDYFDFKKGTDREDRLGPERACAQGWVTPRAMQWGIGVMTVLSCLTGIAILLLPLFQAESNWDFSSLTFDHAELKTHFSLLLSVGILCVLFCFLYTTRLSYLGWGDLLVLIFFGLIPVFFTHHVMMAGIHLPTLNIQLSTLPLVLAGLAMGLATDNLLMVNNYRDRHQDVVSGKRTIFVRIIEAQKRRHGDQLGQKKGEHICQLLYLWLGILAVLLALVALFLFPYSSIRIPLMLIYLVLHFKTFQQFKTLDGKALNSVLGATARNIFLFGLLLAVSVFL